MNLEIAKADVFALLESNSKEELGALLESWLPDELAELCRELSPQEQAIIFNELDREQSYQTFELMDPNMQILLMDELRSRQIVRNVQVESAAHHALRNGEIEEALELRRDALVIGEFVEHRRPDRNIWNFVR